MIRTLSEFGHRRLAAVLLAMVAICAVSASAGHPARAAEPAPAESGFSSEQQKLNIASFEYVWTTIRDRLWDPDILGLDWEGIGEEYRPMVEEAGSMDEVRSALNGMLDELGQSHFAVIPREAYEDMGISESSGAGMGDTGIDPRIRGNAALVISVREGSPAYTAGIIPGWEIESINGASMSEKIEELREQLGERPFLEYIVNAALVSRLRGEPGDTVSIGFVDGKGDRREIPVVLEERRGEAHKFGYLPPFYVWIESRGLEGGIGFISFGCFFDPSRIMPEFNKAMSSFLDAPGIILDLRGNPGGIGAMAMGMAGWFIDEKGRYLGTFETRETSLKLIVNPRPETFRGPVAVLVDEMSTSASEFLAGGLQAMGRAKVFGVKTPGAALPSVIEKLPNGDAFQYVIGNYVAEDGKRLEGRGVIPDFEVVADRESLLKGRDPVIEEAIEWIRNDGSE